MKKKLLRYNTMFYNLKIQKITSWLIDKEASYCFLLSDTKNHFFILLFNLFIVSYIVNYLIYTNSR